MDQKTADNITVVVICFKNFKKTLKRELNLLEHNPDTEDGEDVASASNNDDSSGIQISSKLNLPNYDVTLEHVEVMSKQISLAQLQNRSPTTAPQTATQENKILIDE